jgi:hypothetical protein
VQKGIELDVAVSPLATLDQNAYTALVTNLAAQPQFVQDLVNGIQGVGGWNALTARNIKVEFPTIGTDVFDPAQPSGAIWFPVEAATAANAAAFNQLDDYVRQSMGMFWWNGAEWQRVGNEEAGPRTAP